MISSSAIFRPVMMPVQDAEGMRKKNQQKSSQISGVIILPICGEIKQCKSMVIFSDFPYYHALFGLVSYNDPWIWNWIFPNKEHDLNIEI